MSSLEIVTGLVNGLLPEPHAGLLAGILFGVKATLSRDLYDALITTGTLHIIALSGMNISILSAMTNLMLLRFVRRPIANLATVLIIIGFIALVGVSPSVIRAALMGGLSLMAVSLGRQMWPIFGWILAVSTMLVLNPLWIGDLSFQLSVMATLGIILFGKKQDLRMDARGLKVDLDLGKSKVETPASSFHRLFAIIWFVLQDDLRVTLAAQVFTVPIILFQFHRISIVSPLTNIFIGWLIEPIMIVGLVMVAVGLVWMPLAVPLAWMLWVPLQFVIIVIELTSRLPFASIAF